MYIVKYTDTHECLFRDTFIYMHTWSSEVRGETIVEVMSRALQVCTCTFINTYIHIYVYVYIYIYIVIYTYIYERVCI